MNAYETVGLISGGVVIVTGLVTLGSWGIPRFWATVKRFMRFLDDYEGTPARPGFDAQPGVMERLKTLEEGNQSQTTALTELQGQVQSIAYELPKNGVPLSHKIESMSAKTDEMSAKTDELWAKYVADPANLREKQ